MSALPGGVRAAAVRVLRQRGAADLIPVLGLDLPRRGSLRRRRYSSCAEPGCTRPVRAKGWCNSHYTRDWRARQAAEGRYRHGTATGYRCGCRCGDCSRAERDYRAGGRRTRAGAG